MEIKKPIVDFIENQSLLLKIFIRYKDKHHNLTFGKNTT